MPEYRYIFVGGLHRSGTSLLFKCLRDHPDITGFENTGVPEDEGQHLQSVFPAAKRYGGPGKFGFAQAMHLTEASPLVTDENRRRLLGEWERYWEAGKTCRLEESPPNLIKSRFLQAMFPESWFIFLLRHPVAVVMATKKWKRRTAVARLIEHWLVCHEIMREDYGRLRNATVIRYEHFVADPAAHLVALYDFLQLVPHPTDQQVMNDVNEKYFRQWDEFGHGWWAARQKNRILRRFESRANAFGYSLAEPHRPVTADWPPPPTAASIA